MLLGYCRVSTAEQAADGTTSLAEQERKTRAVAMMRGAGKFDFSVYVDTGVSGSVPLSLRPEGARLLTDAKSGDIVVAAKLDRLFRSATDALSTVKSLKDRGVDTILVDLGMDPISSNGVSKLVFGILASVAEFERERIAERMEDGRAAKREGRGFLGGAPPYGYRVVGQGRLATLEEDESEQVVISRVRKFAERKLGPFAIARELNERGVLPRSGKQWFVPQVQRILERQGTVRFG